MPCDVKYRGLASSITSRFERTRIEMDQDMHDEYGSLHGSIRTMDKRFKLTDDYCIEARLFDVDGTGVFMTQEFLYLEQPQDAALCEQRGWIGVSPSTSGLAPEECMAEATQQWLTENYRTYIHTHESPQDVFIIQG